MSLKTGSILPQWLEKVPKKDREAAKVRFLVRLAALYHTETGDSAALAVDLGLQAHYFANLHATKRRPPPNICVQIESVVGRHAFRRELVHPELFADLPA